jgi:hypothetical protein
MPSELPLNILFGEIFGDMQVCFNCKKCNSECKWKLEQKLKKEGREDPFTEGKITGKYGT